MTQSEFNILSNDLRSLAVKIPLHWGSVQNNRVDDNINMFAINSFSELESKIANFSDYKKNYLRRRWYLWKCSECDEYLFYKNMNVEKNPNPFDKAWDIRINGNLDFDVKGTVIPKSMRMDAALVMEDPREMIDFFYDEQSKGRRYDIQNRLFIVHHSFLNQDRELYLRCAWKYKKEVYKIFCENAHKIRYYKTHNVIAGVIFIIEDEDKTLDNLIFGFN